jgi:hypothetical protein
MYNVGFHYQVIRGGAAESKVSETTGHPFLAISMSPSESEAKLLSITYAQMKKESENHLRRTSAVTRARKNIGT